VAGIVNEPFNLTPANARSPMRFKLAGKKVGVMVVSANAVRESNANSLISTTLNALAAVPFPLYAMLDPAYTSGMAGNAPQLLREYAAFAGLMPASASVRSVAETTENTKLTSAIADMGVFNF